MPDIRCENKLHGILVDATTFEVKCDSRFCGARPGITVLHRFDIRTGAMIDTHRYISPGRSKTHATDDHSSAVRRS